MRRTSVRRQEMLAMNRTSTLGALGWSGKTAEEIFDRKSNEMTNW